MAISTEKKIRLITLFALLVLVLVLHLMPNPSFDNAFGRFYNSYGVDIALPCYLFLLLTLNLYNLPPKLKGKEKPIKILMAVIVLIIGSAVETLQYFGRQILGNTFDVLDYFMYFLGVMIGLAIDYLILSISSKISREEIEK